MVCIIVYLETNLSIIPQQERELPVYTVDKVANHLIAINPGAFFLVVKDTILSIPRKHSGKRHSFLYPNLSIRADIDTHRNRRLIWFRWIDRGENKGIKHLPIRIGQAGNGIIVVIHLDAFPDCFIGDALRFERAELFQHIVPA